MRRRDPMRARFLARGFQEGQRVRHQQSGALGTVVRVLDKAMGSGIWGVVRVRWDQGDPRGSDRTPHHDLQALAETPGPDAASEPAGTDQHAGAGPVDLPCAGSSFRAAAARIPTLLPTRR